MTDSQIQYYNGELLGWTRALAFYRLESDDFIRRISGILSGQVLISASNAKEMNGFIDQFTVQQQEFDHLAHRVTAQKLKLGAASLPPVRSGDELTNETHDLLRSHMLKAERNFMRIKYSCSMFLPGTF